MAYGSSKEGGYAADIPVSRRAESGHDGSAAAFPSAPVLGKVLGADGEVSITRLGGGAAPPRAGAFVFGGDVIETGADGRVTIVFADGSQFRLAPNTAFALDETFNAGTARSAALLRVFKGVFAFVTGRAAAGRFVIDTPVGRIQASSQAIGIGSLTFGVLTLGLIHDLKAAPADLGLLDDGTIDYRDLKHGIFEICTKEAHPRIIVVNDPSVTVELRPRGGGTVSVDEVANTPAQMAQLQSAFQGAYSTFTQGQEDPQIQQWQGGPNDHANANPDSAPSSVGSSTAVNDLNSGGGGLGQIGGTQTALNIGGGGFPSVLPAGGAPVGDAAAPSAPSILPVAGGPTSTVAGGPTSTVEWISLSGGNWETAVSWSDGLVPGTGTTVQILEPVTVTLNTGETISGLLIVAGATLEIVAGGSLTIAGNVDNAGTIILDDPPLTYSGTVSLTGGGQVQMVGPSSANVISGTPGTTLTNFDNTIVGSGLIGTGDGHLTFVNQGTVDATSLTAGDSGLIVIDTSNQTTNSGIFEATGGGTLTIDDALSNSGKLEAIGGTVDVTHAVTGSGSASVSGGGTFEIGSTDAEAFVFLGNGTLKLDAGSDFTGRVTLAAGAVIDLAGTAVTSAEISGSTVLINGNPETFTVSGLPTGDTLTFKSDGGAGSYLAVLPQILTVATSPVSGAQGSAIALNVQETLSSGATLTSFTLGDIPSGAALTNSNGDALIVTNGSISFDAAQIAAGDLNGLSITLANAQTVSLSVSATAADSNGYEYAVPATESVTVNSAAPTLTIASGALVVNEEGSVALGISETPADPNDTVTVKITGLPADATLTDSNGDTLTIVNGSITLTPAELNGLTLHAGDTSADLSVTATKTINGTPATSAAQTIDVTVDPVAPTLTIASGALVVNEESSVALGISETPADPNDTVTVKITGVPSDATLTSASDQAGITNNGGGSWTVASGALSDLKLDAGDTSADLSVTATATINGSTATTVPQTIDVTVDPVAPTLTIASGAVVVNEESSVALNVGATPSDASDTVTVTISGLPSDAYLTDTADSSTHIAGSTITLTPAELNGLTLHAGDTSADLSVMATTTIGGNTATTSPAQTIDVTVDPVAPTLTVPSGALVVNEESSVALGISETPADPNDTVTVKITGVPSGATLTSASDQAGITNNGGGSWTVALGALGDLKLDAGDTSADLSVTATTTIGGNTATTSPAQTIDVTVAPGTDHWLNGSGGDWSTASTVDWTFGSPPTSDNPAVIDASGSYVVTITTADAAASLTVNAAGVDVQDETNGSLTLDGALTIDTGTFSLAGNSSLSGETSIYVGGAIADFPGHFNAEGTVSAPVDNDGGIVEALGSLTLTGAVTGAGTFEINGNTLTFGSSVAGGTVVFGATTGTLALGDVADFHAAISGFTGSDIIDLTNITYSSSGEHVVWDQTTGLMEVLNGNNTIEASLHLDGPTPPPTSR